MTWDTILEDKLARNCSSTTMSYFVKLREWNSERENNKLNSTSETFLNPEDILQSKANPLTLLPTPTVTLNQTSPR